MTGWLVGSARVTLHPRYVVLAIIDNIIDISTYRQDYTNTKYLLYDYDLISFLNRPNFCNYPNPIQIAPYFIVKEHLNRIWTIANFLVW